MHVPRLALPGVSYALLADHLLDALFLCDGGATTAAADDDDDADEPQVPPVRGTDGDRGETGP